MEQNPPDGRAGKTGKYMKYAIGEIILVVIGILIALWINDWNQEKKNERIEIVFLEDFKREVETDIQTLKDRINTNNRMVANADSILLTLSK